MAISNPTDTSQASRQVVMPQLSVEEEDNVVLARITNNERALRNIVKKFHSYTSVAYGPIVPPVVPPPKSAVDDAREAFLVELATFQLSLKKSAMICEAEARQVEEYQRERQQINDEHGTLRGQIEQLKTSLEDAQLIRRRKIEYDLVAEKVNTLPSRDELERAIAELESDMATIRFEHENQNRIIQSQKSALDGIIAELSSIRLMGKDKDFEVSTAPSPTSTPLPEVGIGGISEEPADVPPPPKLFPNEEQEEGEENKPLSESLPAVPSHAPTEDDIEMGEVEEEIPKSRRKIKEDLEEGEASDTSSALSDPPDD